jgi:hypothetical protein
MRRHPAGVVPELIEVPLLPKAAAPWIVSLFSAWRKGPARFRQWFVDLSVSWLGTKPAAEPRRTVE